MIAIIDFGMGNIRSIQHKLIKHGISAGLSSDAESIRNAEILILPGVGNFKKAMQNLQKLNLIDILNTKVLIEKTPVMGICLGAQLFTNYSEEGNTEGLKWIDAETRKFSFSSNEDKKLTIPHVGWNKLTAKKDFCPLSSIDSDHKFYFTHSYYIDCNKEEDILATSFYGIEFASAIQKENIFGCQFHPEKSHFKGFELILNFIRYYSSE
jgi:glutamine amidotransferase